MAALLQLQKRRTACKGWLTRATEDLANLLERKDLTRAALSRAVDTYDQRLASFDVCQSEIEELLEEKDLDADIEAAHTFRKNLETTRIVAADKLSELPDHGSNSGSVSQSNAGSVPGNPGGNGMKAVHLPKLVLPKFSGNIIEWQSFWDIFDASVNKSDLPEISKFTYLQSLLCGEAKTAIEGLVLTAANYRVACEILLNRFGRKEVIINAHIQALLSLSVSDGKSRTASLRRLLEQLEIHVRGLGALDINGETYGVILTPMILSRLPAEIRLEWARSSAGEESNLGELMTFLKKEVELRERSEAVKHVMADSKSSRDFQEVKAEKRRSPTVAALQTSSSVETESCIFCQNGHMSKDCRKAVNMAHQTKHDLVMKSRACFVCLRTNHRAKQCRAKCANCSGRHHKLLCFKLQQDLEDGTKSKTVPTDEAASASAHVSLSSSKLPPKGNVVAMKIAKVVVNGSNGPVETHLLFDEGSDRSYVSSSLVRKVHPKWISSSCLAYSVFGGAKSKPEVRKTFELMVSGAYSNNASVSFSATEVRSISTTRQCYAMDSSLLDKMQNYPLAMDYFDNHEVQIDILVGLDHKWDLFLDGRIRIAPHVVAEETVFGWLISGSLRSPGMSSEVSYPLLCLTNLPIQESLVRQFWDLESIGISGKEQMPVDRDPVVQHFEEHVRFDHGRYEVALPWKEDKMSTLADNQDIAHKRLIGLNRKLAQNSDLKLAYTKVFDELLSSQIIEEVPAQDIKSDFPTFYLPHRPVVREHSLSTKVRPVFDASAKGHNGVSLNDCLETGPSLLPDIVGVLLRFRRWPVAINADVTKAFLQIGIAKEDRDVHRFLWTVDNIVKIFRFLRVTFGVICSPFLLNATVKHHLKVMPNSIAIPELHDNLYVDDFFSGADTEQEAEILFKDACNVMEQAGMTLSKWTSSSEYVRFQFADGQACPDISKNKVLGIRWDPVSDQFSFETIAMSTSIVTKRVILSTMSRLFDPLGFLTPFVMVVKILFQHTWRLGIDWDEQVPDDICQSFRRWLVDLELICATFNIDRCYGFASWSMLEKPELHVFCDAAESGYGAVVYIRCWCKDRFVTSFVVAKSRVAPLKKVTLPRLELIACLLGARLVTFAARALKLQQVYYCWTDSTIALSWIKGNPARWKSFVANRVTEIQDLTDPSSWNHCPGSENPADLTTRGVSGRVLVDSVWLNGPLWLTSDTLPGATSVIVNRASDICTEECINVVHAVNVTASDDKLLDFDRFGSFEKIVRIFARILRFVRNCSPTGSKVFGQLSSEEIQLGELAVFRATQQQFFGAEFECLAKTGKVANTSSLSKLDPFIGDDGLLRVKGRLQNADLTYGSKHPIILPSCHLTKALVQRQHVKLKHAGVNTLLTVLRNKFWIVGVRRLAKGVKRECVPCQRFDGARSNQEIAPLPKDRVTQAVPFAVTGIDFAGPLYVKDSQSKFYICLFTCGVVRAVHVELCESLTVSDFCLALRRFVARRGLPRVIYSDNAKTFKAAEQKLFALFGLNVPKWKFIAPRSPWWGGWWERLIRLVKSSLKKSICKSCVSRTDLETTLFEIEYCVNSRPLTFASDEIESISPITPNHFLLPGQVCPSGNDPKLDVTSDDLFVGISYQKSCLQSFWVIWLQSYIRNLPPACTKFKSRRSLQVGDVVLVEQDNVSRLKWPLATVVNLHPGKDGLVRSVTVRTSSGTMVRSIQKLFRLELCDQPRSLQFEPEGQVGEARIEDTPVDDSLPLNDPVEKPVIGQQLVKTRAGRVVKPVDRLHLSF